MRLLSGVVSERRMERRGVREGEGEERPLRPAGRVQVRAHRGLLEGARHVNEPFKEEREGSNGGNRLGEGQRRRPSHGAPYPSGAVASYVERSEATKALSRIDVLQL